MRLLSAREGIDEVIICAWLNAGLDGRPVRMSTNDKKQHAHLLKLAEEAKEELKKAGRRVSFEPEGEDSEQADAADDESGEAAQFSDCCVAPPSPSGGE